MPLSGADSDTLTAVVAVAARLRSATDALMLAATAALEAERAGSGRTALRDQARVSSRRAKRTVETSEQIAHMPNVARGLAAGDLTAEHAEVLADAARQTSPEAIDTAAELLETAAEVAPEVLRTNAREFAARHDPDAIQTVLDRQRRDRSAALFIDHSTGMGVLHARLDPISYTLVLQAVENYNDALWRQDGGRDGTPAEIRDNPQRLADSIFEMLTARNALQTIGHPAARTADADAAHAPQDDDGCRNRHNSYAEPGSSGGASRDSHGDPKHHRSDTASHDPHGDGDQGQRSSAEPGKGGAGVPDGAAGRSIEHWRASRAPNQLVIIAEIGVIDGTKPDGLCEMLGAGPVPPHTLDNLSADTRISGALFDQSGEVLWLGRSRRHPSIAQQLAIAIRDRGCVLCRAPMHRCKFHHIDEWAADNGTTDTLNLAALCNDCHDELHNNNQRLYRHRGTRRWTALTRTDDADGAAATASRAAIPPYMQRE